MPERNPQVMEMVQRELKKKPDTPTTKLYEKAKTVDAAIGKLSVRQFHARYPLQVKRGRAGAKPRRGGGKKQVNRDAVRSTLLQLVKDVAAADGKAGMVDLVSGIDKYVDRVAKAAAR